MLDQKPLLQRLRAMEQDSTQRTADIERQHQKAAGEAAGSRLMMEQEALEFAAGAAAARVKDYRAWQKDPGEFDHCPQAPQPGELLRYFASEEGLRAQQEDPLLSSGRQGVLRALPAKRSDMSHQEAYAEKGLFGLSSIEDDRAVCDGSPDGIGAVALPLAGETAGMPLDQGTESGPGPEHGHLLRTYPSDHDGPGGVKLPRISARSQRATVMLNDAYLQREYQAMHSVKTASAELIRARGMDDVEFTLSSQMINFGEIAKGSVVQRRLSLHNVSLERARFSVDQVSPPLKLSYKRAPVPAGLRTQILVQLDAQQPGPYEGLVVVRSPVNVLECKVRAHVVQVASEDP